MNVVILDRDGVINQDSDAFVKSPDEWIPLPGSIEAIARLSQAGYAVYIATNQSGLGRGYFSDADLTAMHQKLRALVTASGGDIRGIYYCPHRPDEGCDCRKPAPGLIDQIREDLQIDDLSDIPVVGDSIRDLLAGVARGCLPILVRTGKGKNSETKLPEYPELKETRVYDDLSQFVSQLLDTAL